MNENNKFLEKASQQILSDVLGYDEGKAYYLLLNKKDEELEKEFSYSKRYRVLKSLYESGVMGKIKSGEKEFFSYILLPPSFLSFKGTDKDIVKFLEEKYIENYKSILEEKFYQIILKNENSLILYLLRYVMKDYAKIVAPNLNLEGLNGFKKDKITLKTNKNGNKTITGIIDGDIFFELSAILGNGGYDYIGYLTNKNKEEVKECPIIKIEKEFDSL